MCLCVWCVYDTFNVSVFTFAHLWEHLCVWMCAFLSWEQLRWCVPIMHCAFLFVVFLSCVFVCVCGCVCVCVSIWTVSVRCRVGVRMCVCVESVLGSDDGVCLRLSLWCVGVCGVMV